MKFSFSYLKRTQVRRQTPQNTPVLHHSAFMGELWGASSKQLDENK